jgi:hypothetical protein
MSAEPFGRLLVLHDPSPELVSLVCALTRLDALTSANGTARSPVSPCRIAAQRQVVLQASGAFAHRLMRELPQLNHVMGICAIDLESRNLKQGAAAGT